MLSVHRTGPSPVTPQVAATTLGLSTCPQSTTAGAWILAAQAVEAMPKPVWAPSPRPNRPAPAFPSQPASFVGNQPRLSGNRTSVLSTMVTTLRLGLLLVIAACLDGHRLAAFVSAGETVLFTRMIGPIRLTSGRHVRQRSLSSS